LKRNELLILSAGLLVGAGLAVFIYFGFDLSNSNNAEPADIIGVSLPESAAVGSPAPDFELDTLGNQTVKLSEMRGKIVVINFWATWCEPCKVEMPFFEKLSRQQPTDLVILAVNFDEPPQKVEQFVEQFQLGFPVLLDPGAMVQELYRIRGYPTTFVVDEAGVVQFHHIGLITEDQLKEYLTQMGVNV
jgi:cytochrome c biogenesis protein CcmG/thiol:disulfide interchange protein DsbE